MSAQQNKDFLEIVEAATKAPSGHNTQPWLFRLNDSSIDVIPNMECRLSVVDSSNRELYISIGAAIENLCLKATSLGYETNVELNDVTKSITIYLDKTEHEENVPLVFEIDKRQTNRKMYTSKKIPADTLQILEKVMLNCNINKYIISHEDSLFEIMKRYIALGNDLQLNDDDFKEELLKHIRFNQKEINKESTGLTYKVMGAPSLPAFISKPIVKSFLKADKQNKGDMKKVDSSSHLVLFTTKHNTWQEWIDLGRSFERFMLTTTSLGIATAFMNQPCEEEELAKQIQQKYPEFKGEYPTLLLRIGYSEMAAYSPRKKINEVVLID